MENEPFLSNKKPNIEQHLSPSSPNNNLIFNTSNNNPSKSGKNLLSEFNPINETSIKTNLNDTSLSLIDSFVELNLDEKFSLNSSNLDEVISSEGIFFFLFCFQL